MAAFALLGGVALYLLAHVALRLRNAHSVNPQRLVLAILLLGVAPLATRPPSVVTLGSVTGVLWLLVAYETHSYGPARDHVRHQPPTQHRPASET